MPWTTPTEPIRRGVASSCLLRTQIAYDLDMTLEELEIQDALRSERQISRTAAVYETLLDSIINGVIAGGTIVEERVFVEVLGVSRTPLREALGRLQGEGFLVRQGRKLVVHRISERDFIEILHIRRILESRGNRISHEPPAAGEHQPNSEVPEVTQGPRRADSRAPLGRRRAPSSHNRRSKRQFTSIPNDHGS